jgi:hypothetical protein
VADAFLVPTNLIPSGDQFARVAWLKRTFGPALYGGGEPGRVSLRHVVGSGSLLVFAQGADATMYDAAGRDRYDWADWPLAPGARAGTLVKTAEGAPGA